MKLLTAVFLVLSTQLTLANVCREGETRSGFEYPTVHGWQVCTEVMQVCNGGNWNGPNLYDFCDNPTEPCDDTFPHGFTKTGYSSPSAPCFQSSNTCVDGSWTGPFLYDSCN